MFSGQNGAHWLSGCPLLSSRYLAVADLPLLLYPDWGRVAFDDSLVIKVDTPPMPQRSLVVLATSDPLSYIVPSFPVGTRLISINNNFLNPSQKNRLMESARRLLREENAPSFLISAKTDTKKAREVIKAFGFDVFDSCQRLRTNLDPDSLVMCRIKKIGLCQ